MTPDELRDAVDARTIDTVVTAFTDHYGRLVGKRLDARFFLDTALDEGTHACDYLLTVDMEMEPVEGYRFANWASGYGDVHLVPDVSTLRRCAWADRTAMVLCDVHGRDNGDGDGGDAVAVAPRSILRRQVDRAAALGFEVDAASELEFFVYRDSYRDAHRKDYADLEPAGWYVEDYHLLQGARVEDLVGAARRALRDSEVPVESSKGEAATGQHELNIRYADALTMADRHVVVKQALKELAEAMGMSVSFMAKPVADQPGSSCHLHVSLRRGEVNAFAAPDGGTTDVFRWFLGGWMAHAADLMPCYAPTVNSYKRFRHQSWAPTGLAWSFDNRTAGFRVVGAGPSQRIECRIPGADANPYLAHAAALASGLDGIANRIEPPAELRGDAYAALGVGVEPLPSTLREATARFTASAAARRLLGDEVVDHYAHFHGVECDAYERAVTDWERRRYFERI
jgi:glutamine synthetase